jgi:lysophospholipase L1-like esterase
MLKPIFILSALIFLLTGCQETADVGTKARILSMGDSLTAWNSSTKGSIPHVIEAQLGEIVIDRSVSGARMIYKLPVSGAVGLNITKQYIKSDWDWVILNGGGNDLLVGCGCFACNGRINRMISEDGRRGVIPKLVSKIRASGAKVIYFGYMRSPGINTLIEHCKDEADLFEGRIEKMAERDKGIFFASMRTIVPHGDKSYFDLDLIHPSSRGSSAIGKKIANIIRQTEKH